MEKHSACRVILSSDYESVQSPHVYTSLASALAEWDWFTFADTCTLACVQREIGFASYYSFLAQEVVS